MIYEKIYSKLDKLGIVALITAGNEAAKSKSSGFMDLHYDRLYEDQDGIVISLAHYFKQNGDLCCDPDMEIRVYPDRGMAEALTFQQALPPIYDEQERINNKQINANISRCIHFPCPV